MAKRNSWRAQKIMAMLPPSDSEQSDCEKEDDNQLLLAAERAPALPDSDTSSARSLSPGMSDMMNIFDDSFEFEPSFDIPNPVQNVSNPPDPYLPTSILPTSYDTQSATPGSVQNPPSVQPMLPPSTPSTIVTRRTKRLAKTSSAVVTSTSTPAAIAPRKRKLQQMIFQFKRQKFNSQVTIDDNLNWRNIGSNSTTDFGNSRTPYDYFKLFFKDEIFYYIAEMTNLYSVQMKGRSINISKKDIEQYIGMEVIMGIVTMPAYTDYWAFETRYGPIADTMSLKKYELLKSNLHFADNANIDESDRYYKIRPIINHLRENCIEIEGEQSYAVDEMMVPYKGKKAGSRRQYMPKKPTKWGFKFFVRAGNSGIVYDFFAYDGANTFDGHQFTEWEHSFLGIGGKTVIKLCSTIRDKPMTTVYFDSWFTSFPLSFHLRNEYGILSLGTVRKDRMKGCNIIEDKVLKKRGRGAYQMVCDNVHKLAVVKWVDNECVNLVSSYCADEPMDTIMRYDKKTRQKQPVSCPHIIKEYNKKMGGVDKADMLIALYRVGTKSHKWYMNIFFQLLDIALNNAWLVYRRDSYRYGDKTKPLKMFRIYIANALINANKPSKININPDTSVVLISKTVTPRPPQEVRLDGLNHLPDITTQGRCKLCGCFGSTTKKTIVGGWGWAWWLVTDVQRISLEVMTLNPMCEFVETAQGVPLTVTGVAQCKIMNEDELLTTACEQFLGKTVKEIKMTILQTLEGHLRAILGTLTVEEVYKDRDQFAGLVREVAAPDVGRMGIEILSFTIKDVYDDVQYLASLGKAQTAVVKRDADVGVAQANRDAGIREAECEKSAMDVKYSMDTRIEDNTRMFKLQKAQFDQEVNTAKAEAALAYELQAAKIKQRIRNEEIQIEIVERRKQIEVEQMEILRREEELVSTVRLPAEAEAYRLQAIAEGKRTQTVENAKADAERIKVLGLAEAHAIGDVGKADAERMLAKAKVYKQYGDAALMALVLEALPKIAAEVSAPLAKTDEIVLVGDTGATGEIARLASGLPPALKTLTGFDLTQVLKRLHPSTGLAPVPDSPAIVPTATKKLSAS